MESNNDLYQDILETTEKIQDLYPDLDRYLVEMPEYHPAKAHEGVNNNDLRAYLDSLEALLKSYSKQAS